MATSLKFTQITASLTNFTTVDVLIGVQNATSDRTWTLPQLKSAMLDTPTIVTATISSSTINTSTLNNSTLNTATINTATINNVVLNTATLNNPVTPTIRQKILADTTYYVRTDGSDSNTGLANTAGGAFLTPTHAISVIQGIDFNNHTVTVHFGTGNWTGGPYAFFNFVGASDDLIVEGNGSANTTIQLQFDDFTNATVQAITLSADSGDGFASLWSGEHCEIFIGSDVVFNSTAGCNSDIYSYDNGAVSSLANYTISGAGTRSQHVRLEGSARYNVGLQATAITVSDTPTYSTAFLNLRHHSSATLGNSFTSSGSATGKKFSITGSDVVLTGATDNLPGSLSGTYTADAQDAAQIRTNITPLGTISATQLGSAVFTASTIASTGSYGRYRVRFDNVCPVATATLTCSLNMQIATNGTAWVSANYVSTLMGNAVSTTFIIGTTSAFYLSGITATTCVGTSTLYGVNGWVEIVNPSNAVFRKSIEGQLNYITPGAVSTLTNAMVFPAGFWDGSSNAITGLAIAFQTGNIATGTISLFGIT